MSCESSRCSCGGRPRCILRAVSSGLALVLSTFGFMNLGELCIFAMLLLGATIQDGGIGVRSDDQDFI